MAELAFESGGLQGAPTPTPFCVPVSKAWTATAREARFPQSQGPEGSGSVGSVGRLSIPSLA